MGEMRGSGARRGWGSSGVADRPQRTIPHTASAPQQATTPIADSSEQHAPALATTDQVAAGRGTVRQLHEEFVFVE